MLLKKKTHSDGYWLLIGDFGLSKNITYNSVNLFGHLKYCSPELFEDKPSWPNEKIDAWSSGIVLYEMLAGYNPFASKDSFKLMLNI